MTSAHALKYHISEMGNISVKKTDDTRETLIPQQKQQEYQPKSTIAKIFSQQKTYTDSVKENGTSPTGFRYSRFD
jgi:hypothetical protein